MAVSEIGAFTLYAQLLLLLSLLGLGARFRWRWLVAVGVAATYGVYAFWLLENPAQVGSEAAPGPLFVPSLVALFLYGAAILAAAALTPDPGAVDLLVYGLNMAANTCLAAVQLGAVFPDTIWIYCAAAGAAHATVAWWMRRRTIPAFFKAAAAGALILAALSIYAAFVRSAMTEKIALGWAVEALIAAALAIGLREPLFRRMAALLFLSALASLFWATSTTRPIDILPPVFLAVALGTTTADRLLRRLPEDPIAWRMLWHLGAAFSTCTLLGTSTREAVVLWILQAELSLGLHLFLNDTAILRLGQTALLAAAVTLATLSAGFSFWSPLLCFLAFANTLAPARLARDPLALAWHLPALLLLASELRDDPRTLCLAYAGYSQAVLAMGLGIPDRSFRIASFGVAAASIVALAHAGLAIGGEFDFLGRRFPLTLPYLVLWTGLSYFDAWIHYRALRLGVCQPPESSSAALLTWMGSAFLGLAIWNGLDVAAIPPAWATCAFLLVELGILLGRAHLRAQAIALLVAAGTYLFFIDAVPLVRAALYLLVSGYMLAIYWRQGELRANRGLERGLAVANEGMSWFGSGLLAYLIWSQCGATWIPAGWAAMSAALCWLGAGHARPGLRLQALALGLGAVLEGFWLGLAEQETLPGEPADRISLFGLAAAVLLAAGILAERRLPPAVHSRFDTVSPYVFTFGGAILLGWAFFSDISGEYLTVAWGLEGLGLVVAGLLFRQKLLRYPGLLVLFFCIGKIAAVDLMKLQMPYRILSFTALGAVLLAASFLYARFRALREAR